MNDPQLDEDLHWRSSPGHRRRPPGANAILAISIVITLVLWGVSMLVIGSASGPMAVLVFVVFGVEALVAVAIAGRVWIAIGPTARSVLRPFGILGPWPMLGAGVMIALVSVAMVSAPFMPAQKPRPMGGKNWRIVRLSREDRYGVTYERAVEICTSAGERIPTRGDLARFDPPFGGGAMFWIEKPPDADLPMTARLDRKDGLVVAGMAAAPGSSPHAHVVCFKPQQ